MVKDHAPAGSIDRIVTLQSSDRSMDRNKTGLIDLGNGRIHFEVEGDGEPMVFLHAVPFDSRMWEDQWDDFKLDHKVIRYDLLGFGKSDGLAAPISRREELYRVLKETAVERAVLVGCSLSGETLVDVALECPDLVSALVLVSTVPGGFEMQGEPPAELTQLMAAAEKGDIEAETELAVRIWIDGPYRQPDMADSTVRQRAAEMSRNAMSKGAWTMSFAPDPVPLDPPAAARLQQIKAPVLIMAGELDNPEILRAASFMAGAIPDSIKVIVSSTAHLPNLEKPVEFNLLVRSFLKAASRRN